MRIAYNKDGIRVIYDRDIMHVPIKSWTDNIDDSCLEQAMHLAQLPFAYHHIALMPDTHAGYGMPIGGVLATDGIIIPNAVGLDISCGVAAVALSIDLDAIKDKLKQIVVDIYSKVPVGFHWHPVKQNWLGWYDAPHIEIIQQQLERAAYQLGTLGGGNHFIEIQYDDNGSVWVMIHSGSRNLGLQVAEHYGKLTKHFNQMWYSSVPPQWELGFLPVEHEIGKEYIAAMEFCTSFAKENRMRILTRVLEAISKAVGISVNNITSLEVIDVHHNYAALENHFGKNVMVHRKGAVRARSGEVVIIPGSMGTSSYIGSGLGNDESFTSCSHGAGRAMSRREAKHRLNIDDVVKQLQDNDIYFGGDIGEILDEAPQAYKDIDIVMENQKDLVCPSRRLHPMAVVKAGEE